MEDRETYPAELQQTVLVKLEIPLTVLFNCDNYWITSHSPPPQTAPLENNDDLEDYYSDVQLDQSQTFPSTSDVYTTNYDTAMSDTRDVTARRWDEDDVIQEEPTECGFDEELEERRRKSNIWRWKQVLKQKGFRRIQAELNSVGEGEGQLEVTSCSHVMSNDRVRLKSKRLQGKGKQSSHRATDSLRTNALNKEFGAVATSSPGVDKCCHLSSGDDCRTLSTPLLFDSVPGTKPTRSQVDEVINATTSYSEGIRKKSLLRPSSADAPRVIREALGMNGMRMSQASNGQRIANGHGRRHGASKKLVHSQSTDAWDVAWPEELVSGWEAKVNSLDCGEEDVHHAPRSLDEGDMLMQDGRPTSVPPSGGHTSKTNPDTRNEAALVPDECDTQHCTTKHPVLNSDFLMKCKTVDFDSACIANAASNVEKRSHVHSTSSPRWKNTKTRNNRGSVQASNKLIKYVINDLIVDAIKDVLNDVIKMTKSEKIIRPSNLVLYRSEFRPNPAAELVSSSRTTDSKQDWLKSRSLPASLKSDAMNGCGANVLHYHHGDIYSQLVETVPTTYVIAEGHLRSLNIYGLGSATRVSPPRHNPPQREPSRAMNEVKALTARLHLLPVGKSDASTLVNGRYNIAVALDLSVRRNSETVVPLMSQGDCSSHRMHGTLNHADSTDSGVESESCRGLDKIIADIAADITEIRREGELLATHLLTLCRDLQHYKFQRYYQLHHDVMQAAMDEDEDQTSQLGQLLDIVPQRFSDTLRPWGVTRNHLRQRRFSIF